MTELHMADMHWTISRQTGKQHQTFKMIDGTKLSVYRDGCRIERSDSFGESLDLLNRLREPLEQWSETLTPVDLSESAPRYQELSYSHVPAAFYRNGGFSTVSKRSRDIALTWPAVDLRLGVRRVGFDHLQRLPQVESEFFTSEFHQDYEMVLTAQKGQ